MTRRAERHRRSRRRQLPVKASFTLGGLALAFAVAGVVVVVAGLNWFPSWLMAINVVTVAAYRWDKWRSTHAGFRVPEVTLHMLALSGGSLGALAGQRLIPGERHKTSKTSFQMLFWAIVALQVAAALWWFRLR